MAAFEQAVHAIPEVLECVYVAGSNDCLLKFAYSDVADLERFHLQMLECLPGVVRSNPMLVLRTVKKTIALDI